MKNKFNKIPIITDTTKVQHWFETSDGEKWGLPYYFLYRINLKDKTYTLSEDSDLPTINDLIDKKLLDVKFSYDIIDLDYEYPNRIPLTKAIEYFKSKGYNVSKDAIRHNFYCWQSGLKSGYRDEKNGYHLFTPCGGNPLSFRLTSLHEPCKDWQKTYEC